MLLITVSKAIKIKQLHSFTITYLSVLTDYQCKIIKKC